MNRTEEKNPPTFFSSSQKWRERQHWKIGPQNNKFNTLLRNVKWAIGLGRVMPHARYIYRLYLPPKCTIVVISTSETFRRVCGVCVISLFLFLFCTVVYDFVRLFMITEKKIPFNLFVSKLSMELTNSWCVCVCVCRIIHKSRASTTDEQKKHPAKLFSKLIIASCVDFTTWSIIMCISLFN